MPLRNRSRLRWRQPSHLIHRNRGMGRLEARVRARKTLTKAFDSYGPRFDPGCELCRCACAQGPVPVWTAWSRVACRFSSCLPASWKNPWGRGPPCHDPFCTLRSHLATTTHDRPTRPGMACRFAEPPRCRPPPGRAGRQQSPLPTGNLAWKCCVCPFRM